MALRRSLIFVLEFAVFRTTRARTRRTTARAHGRPEAQARLRVGEEAGCVHVLGSLSRVLCGVVRGAGPGPGDVVVTRVVAVDLLLSTGTVSERRPKIPRPRHSIALGSDQPSGLGGCNPGGRGSHLSSARLVSGPWCPSDFS
ncbi:hypothetical protein C8T65DRAFT_639514 [Cerioporus squamosus]|nr:hypothetical protein C8T65DRAFT_639514 [Cerioporus squamosus]